MKRSLPLSEREAIGFTWTGMRLSSLEESHRYPRAVFVHSNKKKLHDGICSGDRVVLSPPHSSNRTINGICLDQENDWVEIEITEDPMGDWLQSGPVSISLRFDEVSFRRYERGLQDAILWQSPLKTALLAEHVEDPVQNQLISFPNLNAQQECAASSAIQTEHVQLIFGPPGTGKTHTLLSILSHWVAQGRQPWALTASNAAADHILSSSRKKGMDVLRLGRSHKIRPSLYSLTLSGRIELHPHYGSLERLNREISKSKVYQRRELYKERKQQLKEIKNDIFSSVDAVCSTLGTMARMRHAFPVGAYAIVDEATQAIAPAIWTLVPHLSKLVMVGDPLQLGPTVLQPNNPLSLSLFESVLNRNPHYCIALHEQYRMNQTIMSLSKKRYGPNYRAHETVAHRTLSSMAHVESNLLTKKEILWIDMVGFGDGEQTDLATHSLYNSDELIFCKRLVNRLIQSGLSSEDIGIIAPYSAQKKRLQELFPDIQSDTVDAFQGREKEVIICSFVRSNPVGEMGFVSDPRRLTVSMTRAKCLWVGIGDSATLSTSPAFVDLFDALEEKSAIISAWDWSLFDSSSSNLPREKP